ncbi:hypothetical protein PAHAL_7G101700 [Panicum hallii]|uniref:Uncharacterized protein n=1 Tax=Panicum hallii TaxID=206008 RepID=A0A2S3I5P5_9POAL|nr:hypothetical protein PAHAL_7G101700 [Panicum hallii]
MPSLRLGSPSLRHAVDEDPRREAPLRHPHRASPTTSHPPSPPVGLPGSPPCRRRRSVPGGAAGTHHAGIRVLLLNLSAHAASCCGRLDFYFVLFSRGLYFSI